MGTNTKWYVEKRRTDMSAAFHELIPLMTGAALASNSTGDKATIGVPFKAVVQMACVKWEGASTHATAAVIKFDKRPTAGSDTGRGDGDVAVVNKVASVNKQGKVTYKQPASRITLVPGEEVVVEVTTANGDALAFQAWLLVERVPEVPANLSNMEATT